jgi:hypothetical protein
MLPTETGVENPMKTFRSKNPKFAKLDSSVLEAFENDQKELRKLVEEARGKDLGSVMCRTTLPLIRFHLCDAIEFVINHQVRHIVQAKRALKLGSSGFCIRIRNYFPSAFAFCFFVSTTPSFSI